MKIKKITLTKIIDIFLFCTIFFSFAFIFRINVRGYTIYYYQLFGIITIMLIALNFIGESIMLNRYDLKIIILITAFIFTCIISYFFLIYENEYSYSQYIKGITNLTLNYSIVILTLLYINNQSNKHKKSYLYFINRTLQINIFYGVIQLVSYAIGINTNEILVKLLRLDPPYNVNQMGKFIRVSSFTWDTNFFAYQLLLYMFIIIYYKKYGLNLNKIDETCFNISFLLLFLTFSRSTLLGLIIFLLILFIYDFKKKYIHNLVRNIVVVLMCFILIISVFNDIFIPILLARFGFIFNTKYLTESTVLRKDFIELGINILLNNPFGIGNNNLSNYALINYGNSFFKLHNAFLQIGVENGIFAMCIFIILIYELVFLNNKITIYQIAMFFSIIFVNIFYDEASNIFNLIFLIIFMNFQRNTQNRTEQIIV